MTYLLGEMIAWLALPLKRETRARFLVGGTVALPGTVT